MLWVDKVSCHNRPRNALKLFLVQSPSCASTKLNMMCLTSQHRPKVLNKLVIHQNIGEHLIKLVIRNALLLLL